MRKLSSKLRALWRRRQLDRDLADELRFHLEMKAEETGDRLEALGLDNGLSRSPLAGLAAHQLVSVQMSANGFPAIEQKPMLGRDFMAEDERPGAPPVVMLSYSVWQNR
jgi:hypothetical protein